jgi:predicted amidophosphoribosyltransferase
MKILRLIFDFIYPPLCFHCSKTDCRYTFCEECVKLLEPIDIELRCKHCFCPLEGQKGFCKQCLANARAWAIKGAVFENQGPAYSLAKEIDNSFSPPLIKAAASYLAYQYYKLGWDAPDFVTSFPESIPVKFVKGGDPSFEIAKELSKILKIPYRVFMKSRQKQLFITEAAISRKEGVLDKTLLFVSLGDEGKYEKYLELAAAYLPRRLYHLAFLMEEKDESKKESLSFAPSS